MNTSDMPALSERDPDEVCVNTFRFLAVDAVQQANSGHPGLPLGAARHTLQVAIRRLQRDLELTTILVTPEVLSRHSAQQLSLLTSFVKLSATILRASAIVG